MRWSTSSVPQGNRVLVPTQGAGTLTVLDGGDGRLPETVATGEGALSVAFHAGANQIYVTNRRAGTVGVLDGTSYAEVARLPTGTLPQSIAIDPESGRVYVTNKRQGPPRDAPAGTPAPADPAGDTVAIIRP